MAVRYYTPIYTDHRTPRDRGRCFYCDKVTVGREVIDDGFNERFSHQRIGCEWCDELFCAVRSTAMFCRSACRQAAYRDRKILEGTEEKI